MFYRHYYIIFWLALFPLSLLAQETANTSATSASTPTPLEYSQQELRHAHGQWQVTTQFIDAKGEIAKQVEGTYKFEWVVKDRVLIGTASIPELARNSGILFYINQKAATIEMSSVGADGKLWIMTGKLGGDSRETDYFLPRPKVQPELKQKLRFTRFNVSDDAFESKMEYSLDLGKTWIKGNHQYFKRITND